jgi:hypothetical protein
VAQDFVRVALANSGDALDADFFRTDGFALAFADDRHGSMVIVSAIRIFRCSARRGL